MSSRTRVMFVAWGHSIHAQRRIGLFCDDPDFEVAVVSNYNYSFKNARNYLLTAARSTSDRPQRVDGESVAGRPDVKAAAPGPLKRLYRMATRQGPAGKYLLEAITSGRDYRLLYNAVAEFKPDVLFLQTLLYPCYLSLLLPQRVPRVITFWNGDVVWWAKLTGADKLLKKLIVTQGVRDATAITVNSQAALQACLGYGAAPEKVHLIRYPGVDTTKFRPGDREQAKRTLGFGTGPIILAPRGPVSYQNLDVLIEAAPAILERFSDAKFVFLAPGVDDTGGAFAQYRELANRHGVGIAMIWRGNVPHQDLPVLYQASDIVVSISSEDSLPNCMLEAMASKIPLVMGDIPPIREWVRDGENGFLVPPRDPARLAAAIVQLLENPDKLVDRFVENAFTKVMAEAAGETQIRLVKQLVHDVAETGKHRG